MASRVLRPVLKNGEGLATIQVQTSTNTHYGKQSSPPQFSRVEKLLQQYGYKQPPTHAMASRHLRPVLKSGEALVTVYEYKQPPTHTMASKVLRLVLKRGEAFAAVQIQYNKLPRPYTGPKWVFSALFFSAEKFLHQ